MPDSSTRKLRVYFVVGEASGDALGADLMEGLRSLRPQVEFLGLAGPKMKALGMTSLFDIEAISVMGLSAVIARLPTILERISRTARDIIRVKPDILVLVDSPDFTHRVAKRVRARLPGMPIVKYVCPSVWAWRPGRAKSMASHIDHVLAILPFEPGILKELGGPDATYVGHPQTRRMADVKLPDRRAPSRRKTLLLLPGSRRTEIRLLLDDFRQTVDILFERGNSFELVLPAVPKLEAEIRARTVSWKHRPQIVVGEAEKLKAFMIADAALATSGTVLLELALYRVPTISIYKLDWLMRRFRGFITAWTAALPNLVADRAFLPERVEEMVRPGWLARSLEELMVPGAARDHQLAGFDAVIKAMQQAEPAGMIAARKIIDLAK